MTLNDIASLRLVNQQIVISSFTSARELLGWIGAMQAQDFPMAKWAVGLRTTGSTEQMINSAIDSGEIIRTHLLRPTWHMVAAEDLYWMLELSAPQIKTALKTRHTFLRMTTSIINNCNEVIKNALTGNQHLTRDALAIQLGKIGITNDNNRLAHVFLLAEIEGLICSGKSIGNKPTYALLEERMGIPVKISRDEALEKLARKYFLSHGPATLQDFKWWSGLKVKDARNALESVKSDLEPVTIGSETYWMGNSASSSPDTSPAVYLLPAYDEYLISYTDRSAAISEVHNKKAISVNGIFKPLIVSEGQVIGIWKRTANKEIQVLECLLFQAVTKSIKKGIELAAERYGRFLNKQAQVVFKR
jgi:hypothetical protein